MRPLRWCVLLVFCGIAAAQTTPFTLGDRAAFYTKAAVGPTAIFGGLASSGINQWRDEPPEWGQGGAGFGRRFGYHMAGGAAANAIKFGVSAIRREDSRWVSFQGRPVRSRVGHIFKATFFVPTTDGHGNTFAVSRLAGDYGGAWVSNIWYPPDRTSAQWVLRRGSWAVLSDLGSNAFQEFWPDIKKHVLKRH